MSPPYRVVVWGGFLNPGDSNINLLLPTPLRPALHGTEQPLG